MIAGFTDLETKAKQIDELFVEEEKNKKMVDKELQTLKEDMFRESQELFRLRQSEANFIAEISGAQVLQPSASATIHRANGHSCTRLILKPFDFQ